MSVTPQPFPSGLRCVQVIRKGEVSCCWICTTCKDNEYVQDEFTCKACELGWWPDDDLAGRRRDKMLLFLGDCSSLSSVTLIPCTSRLLLLERTIRTVHTLTAPFLPILYITGSYDSQHPQPSAPLRHQSDAPLVASAPLCLLVTLWLF